MSENTGKERKKSSLFGKGTLSLQGGGNASTSHSSARSDRSVEVRHKRRTPSTGKNSGYDKDLTMEEKEARFKALKGANERISDGIETKLPKPPPIADAARKQQKEDLHRQEVIDKKEEEKVEKEVTAKKVEPVKEEVSEADRIAAQQVKEQQSENRTGRKTVVTVDSTDKKKLAPSPVKRVGAGRREGRRLTVSQALNQDQYKRDRLPSLAAQKRAREKERMKMAAAKEPIEHVKKVREVILPEIITVQELANRMAERTGDVVKKLMEIGVMATGNQVIDSDTAELVTQEFGHTVKRVSESDVEDGLKDIKDKAEDLKPRPPVVTIMGHVDHGKTSLLDAIREADIAEHEAGGITQHIGAYQITMEQGQKITFLDTPGHAAFSEMRARGADVTDIVILVVAANDSVMPQTVEAISHAKAAKKPIIVAINKCDLPEADPEKVRTELLQYEIQVESFGGEIQCIEVSAKTKQGLKELEEAILLQSEVLELLANPDRKAYGSVVEAKMEQGRGSVATTLIQHGTLKIGDVFVTGTAWGKVRALLNDKGRKQKRAIPGEPIEVLGLNSTPNAGDDFAVVENEAKAREIAEFRVRRERVLKSAKSHKSGLDQLMAHMKQGDIRELNVIIKADVHGSVEAIASSLNKLTQDNEEVKVNILHSAVGGITESDVSLAHASEALLLGFNVRANAQARDLASQESVEIRYYSVIYEAIDEVKALLGGLLSPEVKENRIGYAEIREVFIVSNVGKVAGCMVTEGLIKRGAGVRLLRDDIVIHEGTLKTLRRFKDEVKEVKDGFECGVAFEKYDDVKEGDVVEVFETSEHAREL